MGRVGSIAALAAVVLIGVAGGVVSWAGSGNATRPIERLYDKTLAAMTGVDPMTRCWSSGAYAPDLPRSYYVDDDGQRDCYLPPREFAGVFFFEFEGELFLEGAMPAERYSFSICDAGWLYFDDESAGRQLVSAQSPTTANSIWFLRFVGRASPPFEFIPLPQRYGHLGVSQNAFLVDRVIEARLLRTYEGYGSDPENRIFETTWPDVSCDSPR